MKTPSVLEQCGGKRSATPLSEATTLEPKRRRCALPAQSQTWRIALACCLLSSVFCVPASAQYSVNWYRVAGGGGTSSGGGYSVSDTAGQWDAGGPLTGGNYSFLGGFWAGVATTAVPGGPWLTITHSGNSVIVSWPLSPGGYWLQQNTNLANPEGWSSYGGTVSTSNGTNSTTIMPPVGSLFFRLCYP